MCIHSFQYQDGFFSHTFARVQWSPDNNSNDNHSKMFRMFYYYCPHICIDFEATVTSICRRRKRVLTVLPRPVFSGYTADTQLLQHVRHFPNEALPCTCKVSVDTWFPRADCQTLGHMTCSDRGSSQSCSVVKAWRWRETAGSGPDFHRYKDVDPLRTVANCSNIMTFYKMVKPDKKSQTIKTHVYKGYYQNMYIL